VNIFKRRAVVSQSEQVKLDAKKKLLKIRREGERSASTAHGYASVGIVVIAAMALYGLAYDSIQKLFNTTGGTPVDMKTIATLVVVFVLVIVMNYAQLTSARSKRRSEGRGEKVSGQDTRIMYGVLILEAAALGYALYLIEQPKDAIQWGLLVARAIIFAYSVLYLEIQREQPIDTVDMVTQAEIGQGYGMLEELVDSAYDPDIPLALRMQSYQATATLTPQMETKLKAMVAASQAQDTYKKDKTIVLVDTHGAPLMTTSKQSEIAQPVTATALVRTPQKSPASHKKTPAIARNDVKADGIYEALENLMRDDPAIGVRTAAKLLKVSHTTIAAHHKEILAQRNASRKPGRIIDITQHAPAVTAEVYELATME
jgi:hypothetical protein